MSTIGFIGGGNMAQALIKGLRGAGLYKAGDILVSDIRPQRLEYLKQQYDITTVENNSDIARRADIVVLAVKPQNIDEALEQIKDSIRTETLIISIAAGVRISKITKLLGKVAVVRVMPNTPALIGEGASALFANEQAASRLAQTEKIFAAVGQVVVIDDEDLMDTVTAVSGSGPAYFFLLTEEMIKAAQGLGLSEKIAKKIVLQTFKGAALLAEQADKNGETVQQLREKVTSPGGTTEAALKVFAESEFGSLVSAAIKQARNRGKLLSK